MRLPEENRSIGYFGQLRKDYLRQVHPARYQILFLRGELWNYLADLNEQAQERLDTIMEQIKEAKGVTEKLKMQNAMEWVGLMNNIRDSAEKIVLETIVYV